MDHEIHGLNRERTSKEISMSPYFGEVRRREEWNFYRVWVRLKRLRV